MGQVLWQELAEQMQCIKVQSVGQKASRPAHYWPLSTFFILTPLVPLMRNLEDRPQNIPLNRHYCVYDKESFTAEGSSLQADIGWR